MQHSRVFSLKQKNVHTLSFKKLKVYLLIYLLSFEDKTDLYHMYVRIDFVTNNIVRQVLSEYFAHIIMISHILGFVIIPKYDEV